MTSLRRLEVELSLPIAAGSLVTSLLLLVAFSSDSAHVAGWALACPVVFLLVANQRRTVKILQTETGIVTDSRTRWIAAGLLVAGLVVGGIHAWLYAWNVS